MPAQLEQQEGKSTARRRAAHGETCRATIERANTGINNSSGAQTHTHTEPESPSPCRVRARAWDPGPACKLTAGGLPRKTSLVPGSEKESALLSLALCWRCYSRAQSTSCTAEAAAAPPRSRPLCMAGGFRRSRARPRGLLSPQQASVANSTPATRASPPVEPFPDSAAGPTPAHVQIKINRIDE